MIWGFHCKYCFSVTKMPVPFWTLLFKYWTLLLKIGPFCIIILSRKVKNTFSVAKIYKEILQLRRSNVSLHLKYKVFFCDPNIEFIILAGGKALASDHRGTIAHLLIFERTLVTIIRLSNFARHWKVQWKVFNQWKLLYNSVAARANGLRNLFSCMMCTKWTLPCPLLVFAMFFFYVNAK